MCLKISILICVYFISVMNCVIPNLSVRKIESKLIERKRQDTLEICRIFNEENNRNRFANNTSDKKNYNTNNRRRVKRDADDNELNNSILNQDDMVRVEKIVDKLYDDLDPTGSTVPFRRRNLLDLANYRNKSENLHRRLNFAPAQLLGPLPKQEGNNQKPLQSNAVKVHWIKKWKYGIIPFFIDSKTYDSFLAETIVKVFDYIEKTTCIRLQRLREKPTDMQSMQSVEWLYITNPSGIRQCVHTNERKPNTGVQMVVFGYDCLSQGEIAHEIMHVLGFPHEHTRPDRDHYITVLWDNIKPGYKKYFEIRNEDPLSNLPYDYASVLHYPSRAFSKNGQITLRTESAIKIGQRDALSELDVEKIRMIYGLECVERNKDYLTKTCETAVKFDHVEPKHVDEEDIKTYFRDRIWPYGIINYKIKDALEFTAEERDNIKAVINHIEKETCIEFRDSTAEDNDDNDYVNKSIDGTTEEPKTESVVGDNNANIEIELENENVTQENDDDEEVFDLDLENENITLYDEDVTSDPSNLKLTMKVTIPSATFNKTKTNTYIETLLKRRKHEEHARYSKMKKEKLNKKRVVSVKKSGKTIRVPLPISYRRHSANVIVIKRSTNSGCNCPPPGRPNGNKNLIINSDCFNSVNDLLHLFVHVLGLDHQHNMHDRSKYLHIIWDNITPEIRKEMEETLPPAASAGFAYDYQSVMHYPWLQIKNGVTNIMYPVWNDGWAMGHWQGLSWTDVQKIEHIYKEQCEKRRSEMRTE